MTNTFNPFDMFPPHIQKEIQDAAAEAWMERHTRELQERCDHIWRALPLWMRWLAVILRVLP